MTALTKARKFHLFFLIVLTAIGYYFYDLNVNHKKIFKCVDPNLTFTMGQQSYTVAREDISSIKPVDGETIWRPEYAKERLPCDSRPVVTHADLYFHNKHSYFIDLKDPIVLTDEQKKGTHQFFLTQVNAGDAGEKLPDGTTRYAVKKDGPIGERTFYILPAEISTDVYSNPLAVSCYVRRYPSVHKDNKEYLDERCALRFLATNNVFVDFDFVKKGDNFELLSHIKDHLEALKAFEAANSH